MKTVAFCEVDKKCQAVLKKNWPGVPIFDDVSNLKGEDIEETVDVICGGFPCQDISLAGKGAGLEGKRSGLWSEFKRLIEEIKPKYAIIENVSALRSRGLDQVLREISEIGYDAEWHCITASSIGAPHRRDRIWIVAYPRDNTRRDSIEGSLGRNGEGELEERIRTSETTETTGSSQTSEAMAYANGKGLERQWQISSRISKELQDISYSRWWKTEPNVGRVAHGIPGRVDRLKQLGNAVVPQIPELIGRAICQVG
jgi:DNA (cytosine-5)-methyltransferase 1